MSNAEMSLPEKNRDEITALKLASNTLSMEVKSLGKTIDRIENNHLAHLKADIESLVRDFNKFSSDTSSKLGAIQLDVANRINALNVEDAKQKPTQDIVKEAIKFTIIAVIGAILALVIKGSV